MRDSGTWNWDAHERMMSRDNLLVSFKYQPQSLCINIFMYFSNQDGKTY